MQSYSYSGLGPQSFRYSSQCAAAQSVLTAACFFPGAAFVVAPKTRFSFASALLVWAKLDLTLSQARRLSPIPCPLCNLGFPLFFNTLSLLSFIPKPISWLQFHIQRVASPSCLSLFLRLPLRWVDISDDTRFSDARSVLFTCQAWVVQPSNP